MKKTKVVSDEFVLSVGLLLATFFIFQAAIIPSIVKGDLVAAARMAGVGSGDIVGTLRSVSWEEFDEKNKTINDKFLGYYLEKTDGTTAKISVPKEMGEDLDGARTFYNTKTGKLDIDIKGERRFDQAIGLDAVPEYKKVKTLVLLTEFSNSTQVGITAEEYEDRLFGNNGYVSNFYDEMTHGKVQFDADVRGWYKFPESGSAYTAQYYDYCFVPDSAIVNEMADLYQFDIYEYDMIISISNCEEYENLGGISEGTLESEGFEFIRILGHHDRLGVYSESSYTDWPGLVWNINHEIGHTMGDIGSGHANGYDCGDTTLGFNGNTFGVNNCNNINYGNPFDAMGDWGGRIFSLFMQRAAGWITDQDILGIYDSGQYFINNLQSPSGIVGAEIYIPGTNTPLFAVEHRKSTGFDSTVSVGNGSVSDGLILYVKRARTWRIVDSHPTNLPFKDDLVTDSISQSNPFYSEEFGIGISVSEVTDEGISFSVDYSGYDNSPCGIFLSNNPTPFGEHLPVPAVYQTPNYPIIFSLENLYYGISDEEAPCVQSFHYTFTVIDSDIPNIIGDNVDYVSPGTGPYYTTAFDSSNSIPLGEHYITIRQMNVLTGEYLDRHLVFSVVQ